MSFALASQILMVRPAGFGQNAETAISNTFQQSLDLSPNQLKEQAVVEFDRMVSSIREHGIKVTVMQDTPEPPKPDAVFPNNWFSTHPDGRLLLYPMLTPNRRIERQNHIVAELRKTHSDLTDWSHHELENRIVEGTGSLVFDHHNRVAYAALSPRTDASLTQQIADSLNYQACCFTATNDQGVNIYHTNVLMAIGPGFVVICLESIRNTEERERVKHSFQQGGLEVIDITLGQMGHFCGNLLAVANETGQCHILMSQSAFDAFSDTQQQALARFGTLLPFAIPTIETIGGGSVRCMVAEVWEAPLKP